MKSFFCSILLFSLVFTCASCSSLPENKTKNANVPTVSGEKMVDTGNRLLEAFKNGDYEKFSCLLYPQLKKEFTLEKFESGRKQIIESAGDMTRSRYIGVLSGPVFKNYLWAVEFSRKPSSGKPVVQDLLFKVSSAELDGAVQVVSFGFLL